MTYPETWPGTAIVKSLHTPFNWRTQPKATAYDQHERKRGPKPALAPKPLFTAGGPIQGKAEAVLRDNTTNRLCTPIATQSDADKTQRIKGRM